MYGAVVSVELYSTGVAVDVADGDGGGEGEVSNESLPSLLSLASTLPPSPSSWLKVGRIPAFLPTNLIKHVALIKFDLDPN